MNQTIDSVIWRPSFLLIREPFVLRVDDFMSGELALALDFPKEALPALGLTKLGELFEETP